MPTRLEILKEKKKQLDNRIRSLEMKEKHRQRKMETRKKILIGAMAMEWMEKEPAFKAKVMDSLERFLTRKVDRELFGMKDT